MANAVLLVNAHDCSQKYHKYWYKYWLEFYKCKDLIPTVFLTETIDPKFEGVDTFLCGSGLTWGKCILKYLNQCEYEQIIFTNYDYFFTYTPKDQREKILDLLDCFEEEQMNLLKISGSWAGNPQWNKPETNPFFYDFTYFSKNFINEPTEDTNKSYDIYKYNGDHPYLISQQCSIWRNNFLLSTIKPFYSPWNHEMDGTIELRKRNVKLHCYLEESPFPYVETVNRGNIRLGCEHFFKD